MLAVTTLLDAKPPKPPRGIFKYVSPPLLVLFLVLISIPVAYRLWNYPEERVVAHFLTALEQGKYQEAYRLWQPSPSYSFANFLHDWGERGDYGKIQDYEILDSKSKGKNTVIITVRINHVDPPAELLVDRRSKGMAYSFF